jgi:hypothetical protein
MMRLRSEEYKEVVALSPGLIRNPLSAQTILLHLESRLTLKLHFYSVGLWLAPLMGLWHKRGVLLQSGLDSSLRPGIPLRSSDLDHWP